MVVVVVVVVVAVVVVVVGSSMLYKVICGVRVGSRAQPSISQSFRTKLDNDNCATFGGTPSLTKQTQLVSCVFSNEYAMLRFGKVATRSHGAVVGRGGLRGWLMQFLID